MNSKYNISSFCHIKNNRVSLNGSVIFNEEHPNFSDFIKAAYKTQNTKYPKFFKMDNLSKLAFLAADILLKKEQLDIEKENNIALVFSNKASSLDTDIIHQKAIQDKDNYFPSPAVFVYTLPNICLGEISIKYKLYSENSFFIFERFNAEHLMSYTNSLLETNKAKSVLCGWVELEGENYEAFLYLVSNEGEIKHNKQNIITLYNT
ncbi:3-oxoacyl-ACP synthase [Xanthomarina sp. F1114]|uniref:3-oxoacyl-ACP synthase n=1 Tax=Xanthomarina sp. F1114 TaxID=2996019 RepID=UPI00225E05B1|nr:3-oxoacyl-ACP synthase [Xanthomarina sp. F1114]MCX7548902.1 3-oxoacyl-ACP synthase [Xanthomarina sp. F1114]